MAEVTAEAMPRLRSMKDLNELLDRDQPSREPGRPAPPQLLGAALQRRATTPIDVIKLKDIVDGFEDAADAFEKVANTVESIAVKES